MNEERKHWLDKPGSVRLLVRILIVVCVLLVSADFLYHKHIDFAWQGWIGFYAIFGFVTFFLAVLAGKELRKVLMRREDYYDR